MIILMKVAMTTIMVRIIITTTIIITMTMITRITLKDHLKAILIPLKIP